ncbi:peptidase C14 [Micromonospora echinofusca]|uniref:Peptidase C14 n=1 Tax=Micromonospora echinofusca TaxID=47858 RepID=A0ABS3VJC2_MICEH|nr:peptidase C14 [Micromonospora echinofusca]
MHTGVGDFRTFGVFDRDTPADAALDAMVADPSIRRIEAHTDLRFVKRHTFDRSDIELDFGGHTVHTDGIERNTHDNPFGAVLYFRGRVTDTTITHTLTETVPELSDVFQVPDSARFAVGQWWTATSNALAGRDERELQKMVQVTAIVDGTHIRVNYLNGWELAPGRTVTWTRVEPVQRAHVRNMVFHGYVAFTGEYPGSGPDDREYSGSHPVAYEYAVRCDVSGIDATGTWWPVIMRRWCTHFTTADCTLKNPPTVMYGGAGYLTQQIYCLYGHIVDCRSSNARHLNDLTASAYCTVENCHGDGDDAGGNPFTTHGQYEHDLVFTGNSGLMDIANSGSQWGISAKRITIQRHVCSWFVAGTKITDLTLEDVRVIARSTFDPAGTLQVNADGIQMRGCSARTLSIAQRSARSRRPNIIADCDFDQPAGTVIVQTPVSNPVHFVRTTFRGLNGAILRGAGPVHFTDCTLTGSPDAAPLSIGSAEVVVHGGTLTDTGIELSAVRDQRLVVDGGARLVGTNARRALLSRAAGPGKVRVELGACTSSTTDADTAHVRIDTGTNRYRATGTRFSGGRLVLAEAGFGGESTLLHTGCVEEGVARALPADSARVATGDNLTL